jgi:hypothetical protein
MEKKTLKYKISLVLVLVVLSVDIALAQTSTSTTNTAPSAAASPPFSFTTIDFPGANRTQAIGLNDHGSVVGDYRDSSGVFRGYVLSEANFTTFDVPGSVQTRSSTINNLGVNQPPRKSLVVPKGTNVVMLVGDLRKGETPLIVASQERYIRVVLPSVDRGERTVSVTDGYESGTETLKPGHFKQQ